MKMLCTKRSMHGFKISQPMIVLTSGTLTGSEHRYELKSYLYKIHSWKHRRVKRTIGKKLPERLRSYMI